MNILFSGGKKKREIIGIGSVANTSVLCVCRLLLKKNKVFTDYQKFLNDSQTFFFTDLCST